MNLTKLIPGYIEIRSLYWVRYLKRMEHDLAVISELIDVGQYSAAERRIKKFEDTYRQEGPTYICKKYAEIFGMKSMVIFLYSGSI